MLSFCCIFPQAGPALRLLTPVMAIAATTATTAPATCATTAR
jgi:hypothetical protein